MWFKKKYPQSIEFWDSNIAFQWFAEKKYYPKVNSVFLVQSEKRVFIATFDKTKKCFIGSDRIEIIDPIRWASIEYFLSLPSDAEPIYFKDITFKGKIMNVAETMVVNLLTDLKKNQEKVQNFITSGIIPADMKKIIEEIEKILSYLKPVIDEIDALIPASMPELKLVFDWAVKIINAIPS